MSEQDYLQRLGLANTLLSGEASRVLPYQITPYQQAELDLRKYALENQRYIEGLRGLGRTGNGYGSGGGGGTYRGIGVPTSPYSAPTVPPYGGTGFGTGPFGGGLPASAYMTGGGGGAGGGSPWTLNDAYDWLGFGDFGNQPGDTTIQFGQYPEPPDFEDQFWD
jgi:hypothetical protein